MLVLKRHKGQWVEITHKSGDKMSICVNKIVETKRPDGSSLHAVDLCFDDKPRNFEILRPDRARKDPVPSPAPS